ncbi:MAG TPA: DUF5995 family protein [Longimicrobium sp.]|nr:DUF5995 family protein [Longimicrobium sp.]
MPANTIDEVIARLDDIVASSIRTGDRKGYFAALYNRVTRAVKEGIAKGKFENGPRMERLDVVFANRYLAAYDAYVTGELPSRSWLKAFAAAENPHHVVLQHLLVGMNAHINLDLGVAAARVCPGAEIAGLEGDFTTINNLLATETPIVEKELDTESAGFKFLAGLLPQSLELNIVGTAMDGARVEAWDFAVELAPLSPQDQLPHMARRDGVVADLADVVLCDGVLSGILHIGESEDVAANIRILAQGELRTHLPPAPVGD